MTLRTLLVATLALPVIGMVYVRALARRLPAAALALPVIAVVYGRTVLRPRPALRLSLLLGVGGLLLVAASSMTGPGLTSARAPAAVATVAPDAFTPVGGLMGVPSAVSVAAPGSASPSVDAPALAAEVAAAGPSTSSATAAPAAHPALEVLPAPAVVRFRPVDGSRDVAPTSVVSVRFTQPMEHGAAAAFRVLVDGTAVAGATTWAEDDTVLVMRLGRATPAGSTVRLVVGAEARSFAGVALGTDAVATFRVAVPPSPTPKPTPRPTPTPRPATATTTTSASGWSWPLIGPITQYFGQSLTKYGYHQGIDIDGETGDPVRAAKGGRVVLAGYGDSCGGIQVHIDHGSGIVSWYRHLSAVTVKVGQVVARGAVVGKVGNTGCSLGSHLHFAITVNGTFVDPLRYLPRR